MDISPAFLKGMAFKDITHFTDDPLRPVQFDFPAVNAWLLRQLLGLGDLDIHWQVSPAGGDLSAELVCGGQVFTLAMSM